MDAISPLNLLFNLEIQIILTFDRLLTQFRGFFVYILLMYVKILEGNLVNSTLKSTLGNSTFSVNISELSWGYQKKCTNYLPNLFHKKFHIITIHHFDDYILYFCIRDFFHFWVHASCLNNNWQWKRCHVQKTTLFLQKN